MVEENQIFFVGLAIIILGLLIVIYNYPQIIYIQIATTQEPQLFDKMELEKFERIKIEFYIGIAISVVGAIILLLKKFIVRI